MKIGLDSEMEAGFGDSTSKYVFLGIQMGGGSSSFSFEKSGFGLVLPASRYPRPQGIFQGSCRAFSASSQAILARSKVKGSAKLRFAAQIRASRASTGPLCDRVNSRCRGLHYPLMIYRWSSRPLVTERWSIRQQTAELTVPTHSALC